MCTAPGASRCRNPIQSFSRFNPGGSRVGQLRSRKPNSPDPGPNLNHASGGQPKAPPSDSSAHTGTHPEWSWCCPQINLLNQPLDHFKAPPQKKTQTHAHSTCPVARNTNTRVLTQRLCTGLWFRVWQLRVDVFFDRGSVPARGRTPVRATLSPATRAWTQVTRPLQRTPVRRGTGHVPPGAESAGWAPPTPAHGSKHTGQNRLSSYSPPLCMCACTFTPPHPPDPSSGDAFCVASRRRFPVLHVPLTPCQWDMQANRTCYTGKNVEKKLTGLMTWCVQKILCRKMSVAS